MAQASARALLTGVPNLDDFVIHNDGIPTTASKCERRFWIDYV